MWTQRDGRAGDLTRAERFGRKTRARLLRNITAHPAALYCTRHAARRHQQQQQEQLDTTLSSSCLNLY